MMHDDDFGSWGVRSASRMPASIVQSAKYMNDVTGAVYGKFRQALTPQKTADFAGGIWDCGPVKENVPLEPSYVGIANLTNKIFSLEEILGAEDEENNAEMMKDDELNCQNSADVSYNESCIDMNVDLNNIKRWRSEEFDKSTLLLHNDRETTRKKSKKSVSFSDTIVDLEALPKSTGISCEFGGLNVDEIENRLSNLKETVHVKKKHFKNNVGYVSEDVSVKMKSNKTLLEKNPTVKECYKFKNCVKLVPETSENPLENQQQVELLSSKKSVSKEKRKSQKIKSNGYISEQEAGVAHKLKNDEFINRSHLEKAVPELFELIESTAEDKNDSKLFKTKIKSEEDISRKQNIGLHMQKSSPPKKIVAPAVEIVSSENEVKSLRNTSKENEEDLKKVLQMFFPDDESAENMKTIVLKLAQQRNRIDANIMRENEKSMLDSVENIVPTFEECKKADQKNANKELPSQANELTEDESQYKSGNWAILEDDVSYPPDYEKLCEQTILEKKVKVENEVLLAENAETNGITSGKNSPVIKQSEENKNNSVSLSRSDSCTNWRSQCIDVRLKDMNSHFTPRNMSSPNWKGNNSDTRNKLYNHSRVYDQIKASQQDLNKIDLSPKTVYVNDGPRVVIPMNLSEPPDPLTRFKGVNTDPEAIWDAPSECKMFTPKSTNKTLKSEEIHAQFKATTIPRFYDSTTKALPSNGNFNGDISEDVFPSKKCDSALPVKINERSKSVSQFRQNTTPYRSFERKQSSSYQRSFPSAAAVRDVFFVIKIKSYQDSQVLKLKILKEDFLEIKKDNDKLSEIIPYPGYQPRIIDYSACAVEIFIRCAFCFSYRIPNWMTALEAFALGKKFGMNDLVFECEVFLKNCKMSSEEIPQFAMCAKELLSVAALKSSKFLREVQNSSVSAQSIYTSQKCSVSCAVLTDPTEFSIPLLLEISRGLETCNESDVKNSVFFKPLSKNICLTGIQLRFLIEDIHSSTELNIVCEVYQSRKKLFFEEMEVQAKSSMKISFPEEIEVNNQIEISVFIDNVLLKMCPQLADNEFTTPGNFHASFVSSKTNERKKLFCIEKLFYSS